MKKRSSEDRRVNNIKVETNRRVGKRRKEDILNEKAYRFIFLSISFVIFIIGIVSVVWGM